MQLADVGRLMDEMKSSTNLKLVILKYPWQMGVSENMLPDDTIRNLMAIWSYMDYQCLSWFVNAYHHFPNWKTNGLVGKSTGNLHVPKGKSMVSCRFALEAIHWGVDLFRNQSQPLNRKCLPEVFIALEPGQTTVGLANRDEKSEESSSPSGPLWLTNPRLPLHFSEMRQNEGMTLVSQINSIC